MAGGGEVSTLTTTNPPMIVNDLDKVRFCPPATVRS